MTEWWTSLDLLMKILWGITLCASLVFVIQSIMTFVGADSDAAADFDTDMDASDASDAGDGINLFTFRNLVNFCLGFGWTAVLLRGSVGSGFLLYLISVFVGIGLVTLVMLLFRWLSRMQQSGNIDVFKCAAGCQGTVYLTIPAERTGEGKVQITINNSVREYNAQTEGKAIPTGTPIEVVEAISSDTMLVDRLNSMII